MRNKRTRGNEESTRNLEKSTECQDDAKENKPKKFGAASAYAQTQECPRFE